MVSTLKVALVMVTGVWLTACGSSFDKLGPLEHKKGAPSGADDAVPTADATVVDDQGVARLEVLAPGELARKIYDAFGAEMTLIKQGDKDLNYLDANAANFVGSISNDPNNKYASSFSIGYFLALAGLSSVVGDNYAVKVYSGRVLHDCRNVDGAVSLLLAAAPTMTEAEAEAVAPDLVQACAMDPAMAAKAIVQSYSFALKTTL